MAWDFATVATGAGLATTAFTTTASFVQAAEQNQKKRKAEEKAAAAMMEARKKLDVNYYKQLGIQKEPYELARRELLSQGALATQQLAEGDPRALAAGVGRIQLAQQLGQEKVATAMQQEQTALEKLVAGEESRLRDLGAQLDLQEVVGAQQAAADAERAEALAIQQGMAGLTSLGGQVAQTAALYAKTPEVKALNRIKRQAARQGIDVNSLDLSDPSSLKAKGINLTPNQIASIPTGVKSVRDLEVYTKTGEFGPKAEQDYAKFLKSIQSNYNTPSVTPTTTPYTGGGGEFLSGGQQTMEIPQGAFSEQITSPYNFGGLMQPPSYSVQTQGMETPVEDLEPINQQSIFQKLILPQVTPLGQGQTINLPVTSYGYGFNPY
jgi:hypothetical protein